VPNYGHKLAPDFAVSLPGGGTLHLQTSDEVDMWEESAKRYIEDYSMEAQNDLMLLGAILTQQLALYRAQMKMTGTKAEIDDEGQPTGRYVQTESSNAEMNAAQTTVIKAADQIRELEKALNVDRKSREAGGQHTIASYVETLKEAARKYGIHLSKRVQAYEAFTQALQWRLRLLRNGDAEDRAYHDLTPARICDWAEAELKKLEEVDRQYAREVGSLYVGRVR
jgi:hypothetical protein